MACMHKDLKKNLVEKDHNSHNNWQILHVIKPPIFYD